MGYNKFVVYKKQYSIDEGSTWVDTNPLVTTPSGNPIGNYDTLEECEQSGDYEDYLTFIPRSRAQFLLYPNYNYSSTASSIGNSVDCSLDSGATWQTLGWGQRSPIVEAGHTIMWRGNCEVRASGIGTFASTDGADFDVEGNIMSLMYGDNFQNKRLIYPYNFHTLFGQGIFPEILKTMSNDLAPGAKGFFYGKVIDASKLILPTETLTSGCYYAMFQGSSITAVPKLPSKCLASACYSYMFTSCKSLATVPSDLLPATVLEGECYSYMFSDSNLQTPPELPATTLADYCYYMMFNWCKLLTIAPELPATTLRSHCYERMFYECDSLTMSPHLPATTLVDRCYREMFRHCENLKLISCLATTDVTSANTSAWVWDVAGRGKFLKASGMTSWTRDDNGIPSGWDVYDYCGPIQFRTLNTGTTCIGVDKYTLEEYQVSYDCGNSWETSGSSATTLIQAKSADCGFSARTISTATTCVNFDKHYLDEYQESTDYGRTWTTVSTSTGSLIKANSIACGYVPPATTSDYLTFYVGEDTTFGWEDYVSNNSVQYSLDSGSTWHTLNSEGVTPTVQAEHKIMFKGNVTMPDVSIGYGIGGFSSSGMCVVVGNPMSLIHGDNFASHTSLDNNDAVFSGLFGGCEKLTNARNLFLTPTTLTFACYSSMFDGCSYLTEGPVLSAATLADECYSYMFRNCSSLNKVTCLATDISASWCTHAWLDGVASSGTFYKASGMTGWVQGTNIPSGWAIQDYS